jgi:hypothetical protein
VLPDLVVPGVLVPRVNAVWPIGCAYKRDLRIPIPGRLRSRPDMSVERFLMVSGSPRQWRSSSPPGHLA